MNSGAAFLGFTALVFSTMEITSKLLATVMTPMQLTLWRFAIGALVLMPFAWRELQRRNLRPSAKDLLAFAVLGTLAVPISMGFFQSSLLYIKASLLAMVFSANPVFVAPLAALVLRERIDKGTVVTLVAGVAGLLILSDPLTAIHGSSQVATGLLYALIAAITFAIYVVLGHGLASKYGGLVFNTFAFAIGSLVLAVYLFVTGAPVVFYTDFYHWVVLLYIGIVVTGLGYVTYFCGMELTSASQGSVVFFVKPFLAAFLSFLILGEAITLKMILGATVILVGSLVGRHLKATPITSTSQ